MYKTIAVEEKINVKADSKILTRKRTRLPETQWDYVALCWRHIHRSTRPYVQCMDRVRHKQNRNKRNIRHQTTATPTPTVAPRDLRTEMIQAALPSESIAHSTVNNEITNLQEENARLRSIIYNNDMAQPTIQPMIQRTMIQPTLQPMLQATPPVAVNITPIIQPTPTFATAVNVPPLIPSYDVNQKVLHAESLDFDDDVGTERVHPETYFNINVSSRHLPSFYEKELIAITEPGKSVRYIKSFVQQYLKAIKEQNPSILPRNIQKRNEMSKLKQIMAQHPQLLHKAWRQAVRNYGDKASFKMLTEEMNTLLQAWGHDIQLKEHNIYQFF